MSEFRAVSCNAVAEQVTDYLEDALPPNERAALEQHLGRCVGCQIYLEQMRLAIRAVGNLREEGVSAGTKSLLLQMRRDFYPREQEAARRRIPLGIGEQQVNCGDHVAYFWESDEDFAEGVGFLEVGLRGSDYCFVFGHEQANQKVLSLLWKKGFDVHQLIKDRRLDVIGGDRTGDAMLAKIGGAFETAVAGGAPLLRLLGNIGWGREDWPETNEILEFEAKVTTAAWQFPCIVVCMYDASALSGRIILKGGFETHPLTVRSKVLRENSHFVPTELFLEQLRGETSARRIQ